VVVALRLLVLFWMRCWLRLKRRVLRLVSRRLIHPVRPCSAVLICSRVLGGLLWALYRLAARSRSLLSGIRSLFRLGVATVTVFTGVMWGRWGCTRT